MNLRLLRAVFAIALVAPCAAALPVSMRAATQESRTWANLKGTIKEISDTLLVVTPSMDKKAQSSFVLSPDAKRKGTLEVGAPVTVHFYVENGKKVVTEVVGKS